MVSRSVWGVARSWRGPGGRGVWRGLFGGDGKTKEERKQERREIVEEISRGYYGDFHEFRKTGGKRFEAADQLCSRGVSSLSGRSLSGDDVDVNQMISGRVSLVILTFRAIGMVMAGQYRDLFAEKCGGSCHTRVVELLLVEKLIYRMLRGWMVGTLRREIPGERWPWFVVHTGGGVADLKRQLSVGNMIVPHVYLLDAEGYVRWMAHATPTARELRALVRCTNQLVDGQRKKKS